MPNPINNDETLAVEAGKSPRPDHLVVAANTPMSPKRIKLRSAAKKSAEEVGFTSRVLPTEEEIREEEIDESLMEIYQDENGHMANVSRLDVVKRHGFFYYLFITVLTFAFLGGSGWSAYNYLYLPNKVGTGSVELDLTGPKEAVSGQELTYSLNFKNLNNVNIKNIEIKLDYPENFVVLGTEPAASAKDNTWSFAELGAHRSGRIDVKGKIVGPKDQVGVLLASMTYVPANFSSEFKKENSLQTVVTGTGMDFEVAAESSVLVGESGVISVKFKKSGGEIYIPSFRLTVSGSESLVLASSSVMNDNIESVGPGIWSVKQVGTDLSEIPVKFKFTSKQKALEDVMIVCEAGEDGDEFYEFYAKKLSFEIIKNDLNLSLILNGSRNEQGIDFDQILNYSIVYSNKGEEEMKDVVIMAVLNGEILDWAKLEDKNGGKVRGNTISWSKEEIPALSSLAKGAEGTIDFSIRVLSLDKVKVGTEGFDPNRKYEVESYAQFSIGSQESDASEDTKSNIILSKVNSDLRLDEQVRYFNSDNIAVGSGPLPPRIGQITSFKVYWVLTNNLHELNSLKVESVLPANVQWDDKNRTSVGSLSYDSLSRKVVWDIGRLPLDVPEISAEFSISISPTDLDSDKIMVLLTGSTVSANDNVTNAAIGKTTKAKTTKLEDDDIANSDGRVVR